MSGVSILFKQGVLHKPEYWDCYSTWQQSVSILFIQGTDLNWQYPPAQSDTYVFQSFLSKSL